MDIELLSHQREAVANLSNGKILAGDVGTGKSITAIAYYYTKECGGTIKQDISRTTTYDESQRLIYHNHS